MQSLSLRKTICVVAAVALTSFAPIGHGQTSPQVTSQTQTAVRQLVGDILVNGKAYDYDRDLADGIGPRLTGSENYNKAVSWTMEQFHSMGLKNIHTESFKMPALWEPETPAQGRITSPRAQNLHIYSAGWSPSTPEGGIKGEVVYLNSIPTDAELAATRQQVADKVVLFDNQSMGTDLTFETLVHSFIRVHELHARAVLMTGKVDGTQRALPLLLYGNLAEMPVAQIGLEDELLIKRMLEKGAVTVEFSFKNRTRKNVEVQNVIAEIPGSEVPAGSLDSVVIVGAHLDSWHPGTGAQDNGTGVATVLDVARAIEALGRPPRRTVRFILFGGEEQGEVGSIRYVRQHLAEMGTIDAIVVTDTGSAPAKGWYVAGRTDEKESLGFISTLLAGLGADGISTDPNVMFDTDHAAFIANGVPSLVLWNDMTNYYNLIHHQAADTFDHVVESELMQGVATTAATTYIPLLTGRRLLRHT